MMVLDWFGKAPSLLSVVLTTASIFLNDASWVYYTKRITENKPIRAGFGAASIWFTGAIVTVSYLTNHWLIIVAGLSTFIGTATAVWIEKQKGKIK